MPQTRILSLLTLSLSLMAAPLWAEEESAMESEEAPMAAEMAPQGEIARSQFTRAVEGREPTEALTSASAGGEPVYYFSELRNMQGQTVTHLWEYGDQVMAEVKFQVGGPRWRVWSSKNLMPEWQGEWHVTVLDGEGRALHSENLTVVAAE